MQNQRLYFDKTQRIGVSSLIRGLLPGTVLVAEYSLKIKNGLREADVELDRVAIHRQMYRASNNQDMFWAAFQVLKKERPDQLRNLFSGPEYDYFFEESAALELA